MVILFTFFFGILQFIIRYLYTLFERNILKFILLMISYSLKNDIYNINYLTDSNIIL